MPLPLVAGAAVLSAVAVPLVLKVLVTLGVGIITFTGVTLVLDQVVAYVADRFDDLPLETAALIGMMNFDKYVTMIVSAYSAKLVLAGVTSSGALSKWGVVGKAAAAAG